LEQSVRMQKEDGEKYMKRSLIYILIKYYYVINAMKMKQTGHEARTRQLRNR